MRKKINAVEDVLCDLICLISRERKNIHKSEVSINLKFYYFEILAIGIIDFSSKFPYYQNLSIYTL